MKCPPFQASPHQAKLSNALFLRVWGILMLSKPQELRAICPSWHGHLFSRLGVLVLFLGPFFFCGKSLDITYQNFSKGYKRDRHHFMMSMSCGGSPSSPWGGVATATFMFPKEDEHHAHH
eukprot:1838686-Amphidinium_carterae.1